MRKSSIGVALAVAVAVTAFMPSVAGAEAIVIGQGRLPALAVDAAGTAYVSWWESDVDSSLFFCRFPRGATACDAGAASSIPVHGDGLTPAPVVVALSDFTLGSSRNAITSTRPPCRARAPRPHARRLLVARRPVIIGRGSTTAVPLALFARSAGAAGPWQRGRASSNAFLSSASAGRRSGLVPSKSTPCTWAPCLFQRARSATSAEWSLSPARRQSCA
jgi:hypothetical protein